MKSSFWKTALVGVLALAIGVVGSLEKRPRETEVRFFRNVDPDRTVAQVLIRGKMRPGYGNRVDLVEVGSDLKPITGDTLRIWVQHYRPGQKKQRARLLRKSAEYDLLVHCYPQDVPASVTNKNVFPKAKNLIHVYPLVNSDYTAIASSESEVLNFMTARQMLEEP